MKKLILVFAFFLLFSVSVSAEVPSDIYGTAYIEYSTGEYIYFSPDLKNDCFSLSGTNLINISNCPVYYKLSSGSALIVQPFSVVVDADGTPLNFSNIVDSNVNIFSDDESTLYNHESLYSLTEKILIVIACLVAGIIIFKCLRSGWRA